MSDDYIPLLSGKPLESFTPEEFKAHVEALYFKRKSSVKKKTVKDLVVKVSSKTGVISIKINRDPKWVTESELRALFEEAKVEIRDASAVNLHEDQLSLAP